MTEERIVMAFKRLFSQDGARAVLRALAEYAHADEADYCADPRKDAYLQGRRSVVLYIRKMMETKDEV